MNHEYKLQSTQIETELAQARAGLATDRTLGFPLVVKHKKAVIHLIINCPIRILVTFSCYEFNSVQN